MSCKHCGREDQGNPSDHYHKADCEAKQIRIQMEESSDPAEIARLKRQLEQARYVGD